MQFQYCGFTTYEKGDLHVLNVKNISVYLDDHLVFKNISFHVKPQDIIIVTGKNGSGKSTLLKTLASLILPFSGSIKKESDLHVSYLGHKNGLRDNLTIFENILFWSKNRKEAEETLQEWQLNDLKNLKINDLSQGQKKRTALAICLMKEADLYLLDEPTTNLDKHFKNLLIKHIENKQRNEKSIIFSSHEGLNVKHTQKVTLS